MLQNEVMKKIESKKQTLPTNAPMDAVVGLDSVPHVQCRTFPSAPRCAGSTFEKIANINPPTLFSPKGNAAVHLEMQSPAAGGDAAVGVR